MLTSNLESHRAQRLDGGETGGRMGGGREEGADPKRSAAILLNRTS